MLERFRTRRKPRRTEEVPAEPTQVPEGVEIAESDPLHAYLLQAGEPVDIAGLALDSPAIEELRSRDISLVVPLIAQGELLGTLNLGPRLSDQPYSSDDRKLLADLAAQVAPAVKVAQLVRQQEEQAKQRERINQELRVASLIQQTLLPKDLPSIAGWEIDAYYQPAREVGGDFYDFIPLDDGRLGLIIGDVTDKGVPAALVMATTRSTLRAAAAHHTDPGKVLAEVNEVLVPEIPPAMFVTCQYGILDPATGELTYANAGHNLPYVRTDNGVVELRATGMPLGLMPGMDYEVRHTILVPGDSMLLTSDGIAEAHNASREMFGFPRLIGVVAGQHGRNVIGSVLKELSAFTAGGEQEDDVTMVLVRRTSSAQESAGIFADEHPGLDALTDFSLASEEGNERLAMRQVEESVTHLSLPSDRLERLKTAVSEATMNAIEHGNGSDPGKQVHVAVLAAKNRVVVRIRDQGGGPAIPPPDTPDLEAKLAGMQTPRGWGLFLIEQMVDELTTETNGDHHTVELVMHLEGSH